MRKEVKDVEAQGPLAAILHAEDEARLIASNCKLKGLPLKCQISETNWERQLKEEDL